MLLCAIVFQHKIRPFCNVLWCVSNCKLFYVFGYSVIWTACMNESVIKRQATIKSSQEEKQFRWGEILRSSFPLLVFEHFPPQNFFFWFLTSTLFCAAFINDWQEYDDDNMWFLVFFFFWFVTFICHSYLSIIMLRALYADKWETFARFSPKNCAQTHNQQYCAQSPIRILVA